MKQLKFMLAAATAIGLATAAQAGEKTTYLVGTAADAPENFDAANLADQNPVGAIAGYDFQPVAPATAADNESVIKDGALNVNTGTDPLLRALDYRSSANPVSVTNKSLYINTKVQFTVTPEGDTVTAGTNDKLMIYLKEVPEVKDGDEVVSAATTKLMVKAAEFAPADELDPESGKHNPVDVAVTAEDLNVEPNKWYDLKVSVAFEQGIPVFGIQIDGKQLVSSQLLMAGDTTGAKFPSLVKDTDLTYVGFAGEGKVDDLLVWTVETISSVDFTLALGEGVSAVQWTIGGVTQAAYSGTVEEGQLIKIVKVTYADWYGPTGDYVDNWEAAYSDTLGAGITVAAKELTTAEDVGVTVPAGTPAETTSAALAWAKSEGKSTTEVKEASNIVANYLLDVADLTVEPKIEIVSVDASTTPMTITAKVTDADGKIEEKVIIGDDPVTINGSIKYKAAATLEAFKSATPKAAIGADDKFVQVVVE